MAAFRFPPILGLGRGGSLRHQRQEPPIVLIESAGDEHFERDVPARHRLGRLAQDRQHGLCHLAAACPIGWWPERFRPDRLNLMCRVELQGCVCYIIPDPSTNEALLFLRNGKLTPGFPIPRMVSER
jgi:hypothetical protein